MVYLGRKPDEPRPGGSYRNNFKSIKAESAIMKFLKELNEWLAPFICNWLDSINKNKHCLLCGNALSTSEINSGNYSSKKGIIVDCYVCSKCCEAHNIEKNGIKIDGQN